MTTSHVTGWPRTLIHFVPGLLTAVIVLGIGVSEHLAWTIFLLGGGLFLGLDLMRAHVIWPRYMRLWAKRKFHRMPAGTGTALCTQDAAWLVNFERRYLPFIRRTYRPHELRALSAAGYYVLGLGLALAVATLSNRLWVVGYAGIAVAVGDPIAAVVGKRAPLWRPSLWGGKSVGGFLGGAAASFAVMVMAAVTLHAPLFIVALAVGALAGALSEALTRVMDNCVVPLATALAIVGVVTLW